MSGGRSKREVRARVRDAVKALQQRRQERGECVRDQRDRGGKPHPTPPLGPDGKTRQLCHLCSADKNKLQRDRRRKKRGLPT